MAERDPSQEAEEPIGAEAPAHSVDSAAHPARCIVAIGSGKGGVGKSLLAANLGVFLAQLGKRVILLDADLGGANLHAFLGIERPKVTLGDFFDRRVSRVEECVVATSVNGLGLISGEGDPLWAANPKAATKNRLMNQVRDVDVDYLICDLPPGAGAISIDLFLMAQVGLLVVAPEPTSVDNTFRFIKSAFLRRLRDVRILDGLRLERTQEGGMPAPFDVYRAAQATGDAELTERVLVEMLRFRPKLVVNQARTRGDLELGGQLRSVGRRRMGLQIDYLGDVEADDAVWLAVRKRRPFVIDHPESKAAKNIEKVARRLLNVEQERERTAMAGSTGVPTVRPPRQIEELNSYEVLEVEPGASEEEIRRAYRRVREMYGRESMVVPSLFSPERLAVVQQRIEDAHDALLDPGRRRELDLELFPDGIPRRASAPPGLAAAAKVDEPASRPERPELTIDAGTEVTGDLLRRLREARGVELSDIAQRTKISVAHFRAIEDEHWERMPALVYLRGFLIEYARVLRLDVGQVTRTYIERYKRARAE